MHGGYSNVAWFYDSLSQVVFGKALVKSQVYLLQFIPQNSNILIVGGGTGWILEDIAKIHPQGLTITYVEVATKMVELSRKRNTGNNQVTFVNDTAENIKDAYTFDVIITSFLFDNFLPATATRIYKHLHTLLKPGGIWLNTDFQLTGKWWQNVLLKSMLLFFKTLSGVESSALPNIDSEFAQHGYITIARKTFFGEFIMAKAWQKK
jgi:ubiquinone/menaquinone biosynthesis C-methylase UbiE